MPSGQYSKIAEMVENWLALSGGPGFTFQPNDIFMHYHNELITKDQRNDVMEILWHLVNKKKTLEKNGRIYKCVNTEKEILDCVDADTTETCPINWPKSHLDMSTFGFDGRIITSPGDLIVMAGVSNAGKTAFCYNLLSENIGGPMPVQIMINEASRAKFKRRLLKMDWVNPFDTDGKPLFTAIVRHDDWKYAIEPDAINIIDWINMGEGDFYKISGIMECIQWKLRNGVAVIALQKSENSTLGTGGQFSEHLAAVYFALDFGHLTVRKAKEHDDGYDPNWKTFGFDIVNGVHFDHIRELEKCFTCGGSGKRGGNVCTACNGRKFIERF